MDVTISLRAFLGKMASVRQILPRAPSKDTLSDLNAVGPSHYQPGFACLSRLCLATYAIASRLWRLAPPAKLRDPRFRARLGYTGIRLDGTLVVDPHCSRSRYGLESKRKNVFQFRTITFSISGVAPAAKFLSRIRILQLSTRKITRHQRTFRSMAQQAIDY